MAAWADLLDVGLGDQREPVDGGTNPAHIAVCPDRFFARRIEHAHELRGHERFWINSVDTDAGSPPSRTACPRPGTAAEYGRISPICVDLRSRALISWTSTIAIGARGHPGTPVALERGAPLASGTSISEFHSWHADSARVGTDTRVRGGRGSGGNPSGGRVLVPRHGTPDRRRRWLHPARGLHVRTATPDTDRRAPAALPARARGPRGTRAPIGRRARDRVQLDRRRRSRADRAPRTTGRRHPCGPHRRRYRGVLPPAVPARGVGLQRVVVRRPRRGGVARGVPGVRPADDRAVDPARRADRAGSADARRGGRAARARGVAVGVVVRENLARSTRFRRRPSRWRPSS